MRVDDEMMKRPALALLSVAIVTACGGDAAGGPASDGGQAVAATVQENVLGFDTWRPDFPHVVHISPDSGQGYYHKPRREALERLVGKLQGNCTRDGWTMAMAFPDQAPESMVPLLVEALDRAMQIKHLADVVQNTAEAMGRMGRYNRSEIADALLRALQHPKVAVQNAAMSSLVHAGTAEAVREARAHVPRLHLRGQADWIRAVRQQLPPDEIAEIYLEFLHGNTMPNLFGVVVEESSKLPLPAAARLLGSLWQQARGTLRMTVASALHAAGDLRGTRFLREVLQNGDGDAKASAVVAAARGDLEYLRDDVLKLSMDGSDNVRHSVALTVGTLPGENIDNLLATLAVDPADDVRHSALTMLRGRKQRDLLDRLIQRVRTASGSKLVQALGDLSAAGDGMAVPAIVERMESSPREERRKFVQALGRSRTTEAFSALKEVFLEVEAPIDTAIGRTNVNYTAVVFANLRAARADVLELFRSLPRDDHRRRGCLLYTLGGMAADTADAAFAEEVYDLFRQILGDREDLPQMRLLALQNLRRVLTLDDMEAVKELQKQEEGPMRRALTDFLFEFF